MKNNVLTWAQATSIADEMRYALMSVCISTAEACGLSEDEAIDFMHENSDQLLAINEKLFKNITDILDIDKIEEPNTLEVFIDNLNKLQETMLS